MSGDWPPDRSARSPAQPPAEPHPDLDVLADWLAALEPGAGPSRAAAPPADPVGRHVVSCSVCTARTAVIREMPAVLAQVRAELDAGEAMPVPVAARLERALQAERAGRRDPASEALPRRERSASTVARSRATRRRRGFSFSPLARLGAAAAGLLAVVLLGTTLTHGSARHATESGGPARNSPNIAHTPSEATPTNSAVPQPGGGTRFVASGRDYAAPTLSQQVRQLVATPRPVRPLTEPGVEQSVCPGVPSSAGAPLVVDTARYSGRPAQVVVLADPAGGYVVYVVPLPCQPPLLHAHVAPDAG